jgi:hypothetical protein
MTPAQQFIMLGGNESKPLTFATHAEYMAWKRENFGDG